jgi:ribosomal protein L11 methyltransferase
LLLSVSRFEDECDLWRTTAQTSAEPYPALIDRFRANLLETEAFDPPTALPEQDWVAKVERDMPPLRAGRFWVRGSHISAPPPGGCIPIVVDGVSAFGTGHHGSTRGCLLAIDALGRMKHPRRILDVGTGTGILAVAVAKLWHVPVVAGDNDPEAVRVAQNVARKNGVAALIRCVLADGVRSPAIRLRGPYDLITANILAAPLAAMAPEFARSLSRGGHAVLSGILHHQAQEVIAAYCNAGLALRERIRLKDWVTLIFERR